MADKESGGPSEPESIAEEIDHDFSVLIGKRDQLVTYIQVLNSRKLEVETKLTRAKHILARLDEATPKKQD